MLNIQRLFVLFTGISVLLISCSPSEHKNAGMKILQDGLQRSEQTLEANNRTIFFALQQKANEENVSRKDLHWISNGELVKGFSDNAAVYISSLRNELKQQAGLKDIENIETYSENATAPVHDLFISKEKGKELYAKLKQLTDDLLNIDTLIKKEFGQTIPIAPLYSAVKDENNYVSTYFENRNAIDCVILLSEYINQVRVTENQLLQFCFDKANPLILHCLESRPDFLIHQNTSAATPGEEIQITAGMGNFVIRRNQQIFIDGKKITGGQYGLFIYKLKASATPGEHSVPVQISYIQEDKSIMTKTTIVKYKVVLP